MIEINFTKNSTEVIESNNEFDDPFGAEISYAEYELDQIEDVFVSSANKQMVLMLKTKRGINERLIMTRKQAIKLIHWIAYDLDEQEPGPEEMPF